MDKITTLNKNEGKAPKRFYKVGEKVWLKEQKVVATIKELKRESLEVIVEHVVYANENSKSLAINVVKFWDITKLREDKQRTTKVKKDTVLFAKTRQDAIIPSKRFEDGGYDVYASVEGIRSEFNESYVVINPGEIKLIPTGIASSLLPKYRFVFKERGSTGAKGMAVRAGVIDSGYRDEWFVAINNTNTKPIVISTLFDKVRETEDRIEYPASKAICQANLQLVPDVNEKEITYEQLKAIPSQRGTTKLGQSGK